MIPPAIPDRPGGPKAMSFTPTTAGIEFVGNEIFDLECLKLINEYYYGVRIFPGQDPTHVYVGWVTTQYHLHSKDFSQNHVRKSTVTIVDEHNRILERYVYLKTNIINYLCRTVFVALTDKAVIWFGLMNCTMKSPMIHRVKVLHRVWLLDVLLI